MIRLQPVFVANGAAIVLLLTILFSSRKNMHHSLPDEKLFYAMVGSTMLQCVLETATLCLDGHAGAGLRMLSLILNCALYINNICFAFTWTMYADFKLFSNEKQLRRRSSIVIIPAAVVILMSLANLFTPVFFRISAENVYSRTPLFVLPYIVTYLYLAYGVGLIYRYRNQANKYLFLPALHFMAPILLGSVLQYLFYGLSLVWIGAAIALVSLYVNVQNEVSYTDNLSGLFTRQYMNQYLEAEMKRINSQKQLVGIMLDVDQFKMINDRFGHLMGDDAIRSVGRILHSTAPAGMLAVRYAGDEFMVVGTVEREDEIRAILDGIDRRTEIFNSASGKPYQLHFSKGLSRFERGRDSVDDFLGRMDAAMYAEKSAKIEKRILPERRKKTDRG